MEALSKFTVPAILFTLTLAFGFWLSWAGKPYNSLLFNAHKLIALGAVVVTAVRMARLFRVMESQPLILLLIFAAVLVVALFVSGALMSAGVLDYTRMLTIHRIAPVLLVLCLGYAVVLTGASP